MTLAEFKKKIEPVDLIKVDILYSLYKDLFSGAEDNDTINDIGLYMLDLTNHYGKDIAIEFSEITEIKELINHE